MAKKQRGSVVKRGNRNYGVRYYDENRIRRYQGGFEKQGDAEEWAEGKAKEVLALRRGDLIPTGDRPQTVDALMLPGHHAKAWVELRR